ncbi:hypothetical protein [Vibrio maerlii]|uniref:hypothetical protein n=1 Tax=Vibrio maerlii TaxID=2231648 RepID=UPI000E3C73DA|nr:hypothetical protein [Vibrio maerlii]
MKASNLRNVLAQIPEGIDPDVVTGEEWLPEQLINASFANGVVQLEFDNAPVEGSGEEEGRGFVEHEISLIRSKFEQLLDEDISTNMKADAILALLLIAHEHSSAEFIELLNEETELDG